MRQNDINANLVDSWQIKHANGLSAEKIVQLFEKAIQAMESRSLITLSAVTVLVVMDRALHEGTEKFPMLSRIKVENCKIDLDSILRDGGQINPVELQKALGYFLVVLLNVLGNITADILTASLHKELMQVA